MVKKLLIFILICFFFGPTFAAKKTSAKKPVISKKSKKSKKNPFNFEAFIKKAEDNKTGSLIIFQDGKFLVENNWESPLTFYYLQGMTPGIITLALGSLMDEGNVTLESSLAQWIPEWVDNRSQIKVLNLLYHTTGFSDDEKDPWYKASDSWAWVKSQLPRKEPGDSFVESDTNSLLLGFVISKATDNDSEALVKNKLMEPLGIQKWGWDKDKLGHINSASGLKLRNYDILKIGNLWAQNGVWDGKKILSQTWLEQIQKPSEKNSDFGMNWNLLRQNGMTAAYIIGDQGQYLVVIPEKKIVSLRLRTLVPKEQNKSEQDWVDFPKEILQLFR